MSSIVLAVIQLLGGLTFFLYGMSVMSEGLEKSTDGKLNRNISRVTKSRFVQMLFGAGLTIAVQSSSAVTVILVGLVNSGIMEFGQTIGVCMGSNIGTTFTTWITSLVGIDSDSFWMMLLKPENFSPLFAFAGILLILLSKKQKHKDAGSVLVGFAVLMFGMTQMSAAVEPLAEMEGFQKMLTAFANPLLALLVGTIFTGIIQSSAATVAIVQALSGPGSGVTYGMAIPLVMGANIGTCVTALISSAGVNRNAKKVAVCHITVKIIGSAILLIPYFVFYFIGSPFLKADVSPVMIAVIHTIFNVVTTAILLPFTKKLEALTDKLVPAKGKTEKKSSVVLDERLLTVPTVAVKEAFNVVIGMCRLSTDTFVKATTLLKKYDEEVIEEVSAAEKELDRLEDKLGSYMMKLSKVGVTEEDSQKVTQILHTIGDFERIGDHAVNIVGVAKELKKKKKNFSDKANSEIDVLNSAVLEILEITANSFCESDVNTASLVEPLEQVIDDLVLNIKANHVARLQSDECTIDMGFPLSDLLTSYRRVSDHCSNIAVAVLEAPHGTFETHKYLGKTKHRSNENFETSFERFSEKYALK